MLDIILGIRMTKFIFDLDGTITKEETLPLIAKAFNVESEIAQLTKKTINGNVPFIESFIKRVFLLGKLPVTEVSSLLAGVSLYPKVVDFINSHREDCIIATGNLDCWVNKLASRIDCICYSSDAIVEDNKVQKISKILKKESIVELYKNNGERVVFIGDGNNDVEAMRLSDVSIASGLTHEPVNSVLSVANYLVFTEEALCRQLNLLL